MSTQPQPPGVRLCLACEQPITAGQSPVDVRAVRDDDFRTLYFAAYHPACVPPSIQARIDVVQAQIVAARLP